MRSLAVVGVLLALAAPARADDEDHAKADDLFGKAQEAKQAGDPARACQLYNEALHYNKNAVGTLLNVAKCNEDAGKFATAVKLYEQARDIAREHDLTEHQKAAETRLAQIGDRVSHLAIAFTERLANMQLVIDDVVYATDPASTGAIALDAGEHHIVVSAPGRLSFDTRTTLIEGKPGAVAIPRLARAVTVRRMKKSIGKVMTFTGGGLAITGLVLGWVANRDYEREVGPAGSGKPCVKTGDAEPLCNDIPSLERTHDARRLGTTGTIVGVGGAAILGVGLVLWLTAPAEHAEREVRLVPSITAEGAGLAAVGRF
jgi:hypothetical protein